MLADLHAHALPASKDAYGDVASLAAALQSVGVDAVALTDHSPGCDYTEARAVLAHHGVMLIPGRELNTPLGHVLALATDTEWLTQIPESCALPPPGTPRGPLALVWAHPAGWRVAGALAAPDPSRGGLYLHAVEILNGERLYQPDAVAIAEDLARQLGVAGTGGSDAHRHEGAGRCLTEVVGAADAAGVIEGIRDGQCRPVLGPVWAERHDMRYARDDLRPYTWPCDRPAG